MVTLIVLKNDLARCHVELQVVRTELPVLLTGAHGDHLLVSRELNEVHVLWISPILPFGWVGVDTEDHGLQTTQVIV
ncbi:hypothetical protein D3C78_1654840 [compost metagenome]